MKGRSVVVAGAAGAIGGAICRAFGSAGAIVKAVDRSAAGLEVLMTELRVRNLTASAVAIDLRDDQAVNALAATFEAAPPDVLVNAAGVSTPGSFLEAPLERVHEILDINLKGPIRLTQTLARQMARRGSGVIVNITSRLATLPVGNNAAYIASKAGLVAFTKALAIELGPFGVRVNAVSPGLIESEMNRATRENPDALARYMARQSLAGLGQPGDVAGAALFLASEAARFVTGAEINVDGGLF